MAKIKAPIPQAEHHGATTPQRILVLQGHPDPAGGHLCHALAEAYVEAAQLGGHDVRMIDAASLDIPLLRSAREWNEAPRPPGLRPVQEALTWCEHVLILFPLWMGDMPARLKALFEQVGRPGFAFPKGKLGLGGKKALAGRSARLIVTMGMPAIVYRVLYRSHSVKALKRNLLGFIGFAPIHETLIGRVEDASTKTRAGWMKTMREWGTVAM